MRILKAVEIGQIGMVRAFIAEGDDVNEFSESGSNPILKAASRNDTQIVKLLLNHGANPEVEDFRHNTPLFWAKRNNNAEMVELIETAIEKQAQSSMKL